jgi:hypothetical protein
MHPLDPLTADEISQVAANVRAAGRLNAGAWFETIQLDETDKRALELGDSASRSRPPLALAVAGPRPPPGGWTTVSRRSARE